VLIANMWLNVRSGTEVVTRDYALGLARRGYRVAVYAQTVGMAADEISGEVEVVRDLAAIDCAPDIIHGHQHPVLAPCLVRFPSAPAIQLVHDARNWPDQSLRWERVRHHAAVDRACQERVVAETGLGEAEVPVLPNAVDLQRCRPRSRLPRSPSRVLIVANRHGSHVAAIEAACATAGLVTRSVGQGVGRPSNALESDMAEADIVVGAARIALEAMAVGCAALVCDRRGLAGMATPTNFDEWRGFNFGYRLLTRPVTPELVAEALTDYDAEAAAEVTRRVRSECGLDEAVERLVGLYVSAIERHRAAADWNRESRDIAAYLQEWLPSNLRRSPFYPEVEDIRRAAAAVGPAAPADDQAANPRSATFGPILRPVGK
jgi:hypothetical protein